MYSLLDLGASSPDPAGLKMGCQRFRFNAGTELIHLIGDRVDFWLQRGLVLLLSQHFCSARRVIWRHQMTCVELALIRAPKHKRMSAGDSTGTKMRGTADGGVEPGRLR